jgi:cytidylate kinase
MNKKKKRFSNQITITSLSGAGSSSTILALQRILPTGIYRFVSGGGMMRASIKHSDKPLMSMEQYAEYCRCNPDLGADRKLDQNINTLSCHNFTVIESRLGHETCPGGYHVLLECPLITRAKRRAGQINVTYAQVKAAIEKRDRDDIARYRHLYGDGCIWSPEKYDLRISSSRLRPGEIAKKILSAHQRWVKSQGVSIVKEMACPEFALDMFKFHSRS